MPHDDLAELGWGEPTVDDEPRRPRGGSWVALLAAVVAITLMLVAPQLSRLAQVWGDPAQELGPDRSSLVVIADPQSLPAPVRTFRAAPTPGVEESAERRMALVRGPSTDAPYAFSDTQVLDDGSTVPVTFSPCRPVHVVLNPDGAPEGAATHVVEALGALSAATGLQVVYDGQTDEPAAEQRAPFQPERYGDRWAPVLIEFADERTQPELAGTIAGLGGPAIMILPRTGFQVAVSGRVTLDVTLLDALPRGGVPAWVAVLRHELGHVVGLGHVDDPEQLMFATSDGSAAYRDGDLAGLALLGAGRCSDDI